MADAQKAESTPSSDTEGVRLAHLPDCPLGNVPIELASCPCGLDGNNIIAAVLAHTSAEGGMLKVDVTGARAALRTAQNTGRDEEIERAWKQGFCKGEASNFGCFPPTVAQVDAEWRKSKAFIAVKSSPPVSTVDEEGGGA